MKKDYSIIIGWLYPDLMNTYGDRGNVMVLQKRCEWRGIEAKVSKIFVETKPEELSKCDLIFMGGAQDTQQEIVAKDLNGKKGAILMKMIEDGIPGLYICGAYQFLGNYYKDANGIKIPGLGIFDLHTESPASGSRLIGNTVMEANKKLNLGAKTIVGFENHGGRTYLGDNIEPFGKVIRGGGNNGKDGYEGGLYKNSIGSYFHGPILPKNPSLADYLIQTALEKKYKKTIELSELNDSLEKKAHDFIAKREGTAL